MQQVTSSNGKLAWATLLLVLLLEGSSRCSGQQQPRARLVPATSSSNPTTFATTNVTPTTTTTTTTPSTTTTTEAPTQTLVPSPDEGPGMADPNLQDLCIPAENKTDIEEILSRGAYTLNHTWNGDLCNETCRCVFRSEPRDPTVYVRIQPTLNMRANWTREQTEIRCGLPAHCPAATMKLTPSLDCPAPRLVFQPASAGPCACPRLACTDSNLLATTMRAPNSRQPVTITAATAPKTTAAAATTTTITISTPTTTPATATTTTAATTTIATTSTSKSTTTSSAPVFSSTSQLPVGCRSHHFGENRMLAIGDTMTDECHASCRCSEDGVIRCKPYVCPTEPPVDIVCSSWALEPNFTANPSEGRCCPQFICKDQSETTTVENQRPPVSDSTPAEPLKSCQLMGKEMMHGQRVPVEIQPSNPECEKICTCLDGKIVCQPLCLPLSNLPPNDLGCSAELAFKSNDDCCPKWTCPITEDYALESFDVVPMNSSAVEISFGLPMFAVGKRGKAELNYTGVPMSEGPGDMPPVDAYWSKKSNIKTVNGIFSIRKIKYNLGNLKPDHKYWFKLVVHFLDAGQPFDEPLESDLERVIMPPLEEPTVQEVPVFAEERPPSRQNKQLVSSRTSTTTPAPTTSTSTTAAPPTRILHPIQTSVRSSSPTLQTTQQVSSVASISTSRIEDDFVSSSESSSINFQAPTSAKPPNFELPKEDIGSHQATPCHKFQTDNSIYESILSSPWTAKINAPLQNYAWHLLVAFSVMTILFTIVSYLYLKRSSRVVAPITPHVGLPAYDNPTFTKLVSYYENQPHVLVFDESNQNNYNDAILAKKKNMEVDQQLPVHHHGRQHLI